MIFYRYMQRWRLFNRHKTNYCAPMNKLLALVIAAVILSVTAKAQDTIHLIKKNRIARGIEKQIVTDRAPQAVYAELYGRALIYSFNYDRRFQKKLTGLGFSAGVGVIAVDGDGFVAVPVSINNLTGSRGHYFESGLGATFANAGTIGFNDISTSSNSIVFATATLGYRSQPVNGGLNFRAGINFIAGAGVFVPYPYISLGYNF